MSTVYDEAQPPVGEAAPPDETEAATKTSASATATSDDDADDAATSNVEVANVVVLRPTFDVPDDPAFAWLTPEFWHLIQKVGVQKVVPSGGHARQAYDDKLKCYSRAHVSLRDLADAIGIAPEHARGYLRAINERLEVAGVTLRERRLKKSLRLRDLDRYTGAFFDQAEKNRRYVEVREANKAFKAAEADDSDDAEATQRLNEADSRRERAKERLDEMLDASAELPVERHAFVVFIDPTKVSASKVQANHESQEAEK